MALIKCSECQAEVSDKAASCPKCGCPIGKNQKVSPLGKVILKNAVRKQQGYEYCIDDKGNICRAKTTKGNQDNKYEIIMSHAVKRQPGYSYYIDDNGNLCWVKSETIETKETEKKEEDSEGTVTFEGITNKIQKFNNISGLKLTLIGIGVVVCFVIYYSINPGAAKKAPEVQSYPLITNLSLIGTWKSDGGIIKVVSYKEGFQGFDSNGDLRWVLIFDRKDENGYLYKGVGVGYPRKYDMSIRMLSNGNYLGVGVESEGKLHTKGYTRIK